VTDSNGVVSNTATVNITVNPVNDPPVATNDTATVDEGNTVVIAVKGNDTDAEDGTPAGVVTIVGAPANGTVTVNANGTVSYVHDGSETTSDSFTYTVTDSNGVVSNTATVNITVNPVNDPPVATNDTATVDEGNTVVIAVKGNDTDAEDGTPAGVVTIVGAPANGTVTVNANGTVSYVHDGSETTSDSFTYTVTDSNGVVSNTATVNITVNPVNDPPVATNDTATVDEGNTVVIAVKGNDTDAEDGTPAGVVTIVGAPANGTVTVNANGTVSYVHDGSETTSDSFTYTVTDSNGVVSNTATVNITVNPVNDPPVATNDTATVDEGNTVVIAVKGNDTDAEDGTPAGVVTIVGAPANGTVTVNANGTVSYVHDGSETTSDSFTYTVTDSNGVVSNTATVNITVNPVNDPPVATNDTATVDEGNTVVIAVKGNDTDAEDGTPAGVVTIVGAPANGTVTVNANGTVSYVHDGSETTSDSFTYTVTDSNGVVSNTATVNITVNPVNDPPVATNDTATVDEGNTVVIAVKGNDTDAEDGTPAGVVTIVGAPANGTVTVNANGTVSYVHDGSETTSDSFTYTVTDSNGVVSNTATVNITVNPVNDPPVATNDTATVDEGNTVVIAVKGNDTDAEDGTPAGVVTIVGAPANGTVTVNANGTVSYVHDGSETTSDSFTYTVTDSNGVVSNTATVNITVNPVNDPPVATNDTATVDEGNTVVIAVKGNDTDAEDGTPAGVVTIVGAPANGTVTVNANGTVSYVHDGSETTSDSFTYTVTDSNGVVSNTATVNITVNPVNDPPVATNDTATVDEGNTVVIAVKGNDTDAEDGTPAGVVTIVGAPANGTVTVNANGTVSYVHDGSETTSDSFTYTVTDSNGVVSNTATVNITVNPVNDPPVATNDTATVDEGNTVVIAVKGNDTDAEDGTPAGVVTIVGAPANGTVTVNANGTVSYVHDGSETTSDSFTYTVTDSNGVVSNTATVNITVNPVNDPPVATNDTATVDEGNTVVIAVKGNDTDAEDGTPAGVVTIVGAPANGTVTVNANGTVSYVHDGSETTSDSFTYTVTDSNGVVSNTATVNITVNPVNDPPVATNDTATVDEGNTVVIAVKGNDTDAEDGTPAGVVTIVGAPANGTVTVNANGTVSYVHDGSETTSDSFTYTVTDSNGVVSNTATVNITVNPVNDPPVATNDTATVDEGNTVVIAVKGNDTDAEDGTPAGVVTIVGAPANGTVTVNANGTVSYVHDGSETTSDSFTIP
jgi:hypothetical protein